MSKIQFTCLLSLLLVGNSIYASYKEEKPQRPYKREILYHLDYCLNVGAPPSPRFDQAKVLSCTKGNYEFEIFDSGLDPYRSKSTKENKHLKKLFNIFRLEEEVLDKKRNIVFKKGMHVAHNKNENLSGVILDGFRSLRKKIFINWPFSYEYIKVLRIKIDENQKIFYCDPIFLKPIQKDEEPDAPNVEILGKSIPINKIDRVV